MPLVRGGRPGRRALRGQPLGRALLILLLLTATIAAQSSALDPRHESHHAPGHCCLLCHTGPIPLLRTAAPPALTPVFLVTWLAPAPDFQPFHEVLLTASSSRAPPAA
ncbi:MAG: hypothetical protein WBL61_10560 [Bryobacteraceae bacterium]